MGSVERVVLVGGSVERTWMWSKGEWEGYCGAREWERVRRDEK